MEHWGHASANSAPDCGDTNNKGTVAGDGDASGVNRRGFAKFHRFAASSSEDVPPPDVEHVHDRDVGVHDDVRRPPHRPRLQTQGDRRGLVGVDGEVLQIR